MKKAQDLFEIHIDGLLKSAAKEGVEFADLLEAITRDAPAPMQWALRDLLDPIKTVKPLIERYRPQFYEWMLDNLLEAAPKNWKAAAQQAKALAKGRINAVKKRQEEATKEQDRLINEIAHLFDKPEKPGWGWTNPEIVQFLKRDFDYKASTIMQTVKREAAKFRKARKEQQASQYQSR